MAEINLLEQQREIAMKFGRGYFDDDRPQDHGRYGMTGGDYYWIIID